MGRKHHVIHGGSRSSMGKGQFWRIGAPIVKYRHFLSQAVQKRLNIYPFAVSIVDSSGPKDAQVQSYSPCGANVSLWKETLPSPVE